MAVLVGVVERVDGLPEHHPRFDEDPVPRTLLGHAQEEHVGLIDELAPVVVRLDEQRVAHLAADLGRRVAIDQHGGLQAHAPGLVARGTATTGRSPARSAGRSATNAMAPATSTSVTCPKASPQPSTLAPPRRSRVAPSARGPTKPPA